MEEIAIVTASLEGSVFCYTFSISQCLLTPVFNSHDHIGRVKALSVSPSGVIATAGEDESIKLYNFNTKKSLASIVGPKGVCSRLVATKKFLIAAHETGKVSISGVKDMAIYHQLSIFKHPVIDCDLHSSGKLLLCLSKTGRFALWSLADCSMVFHRKSAAGHEIIRFLNDLEFVLANRKSIHVFDIKTMEIACEFSVDDDNGITDIFVHSYKGKNFLLVGDERGFVRIIPQTQLAKGNENPLSITFSAYDQRVKRIRAVNNYIIGICTDGRITIWDAEKFFEMEELKGDLLFENYLCINEFKMDSRLVLLEAFEPRVVHQVAKEDNTEEASHPQKDKTSSKPSNGSQVKLGKEKAKPINPDTRPAKHEGKPAKNQNGPFKKQGQKNVPQAKQAEAQQKKKIKKD